MVLHLITQLVTFDLHDKYNSCLITNLSKMKCVEIIVKTYPNFGSEEYYRLRPNEYSYVRDSFLA